MKYVHGYDARESRRLADQAGSLEELLHADTAYPAGSVALEAGCGVGAQTVPLATRSSAARIVSIGISPASLQQAKERVDVAGITIPAGRSSSKVSRAIHSRRWSRASATMPFGTAKAGGVFCYTLFKGVGRRKVVDSSSAFRVRWTALAASILLAMFGTAAASDRALPRGRARCERERRRRDRH